MKAKRPTRKQNQNQNQQMNDMGEDDFGGEGMM
jgi:hypothetical protein